VNSFTGNNHTVNELIKAKLVSSNIGIVDEEYNCKRDTSLSQSTDIGKEDKTLNLEVINKQRAISTGTGTRINNIQPRPKFV